MTRPRRSRPLSDPVALAVAEARRWIRTPFAYRGRLRGVAASCEAVIFAAGWAGGVLPMTQLEFDERFGDHGRVPGGRRFREFMQWAFVEIGEGDRPLPADIAWISWTSREEFARKNLRPFGTHLALIAEHEGRPTMIHSDAAQGVVEHGLAGQWPAMVVSYWRFPGLVAWRS